MAATKKQLVPELRFKEFDSEWVASRLGDGIELISGQHLTPLEYNNNGIGVPYFTGPSDFTDEINGVTKWSDVSNNFGLQNDVLITVKGNGVGTMALQKLSKVAIGRQLMSIREKVFKTEFVYHFLLTQMNLFIALAAGNLIPGLSRQAILSIKVNIPTLPEQQKIASFLSSVDEKIQQLTRKKELLEQYKKGVMQRLFCLHYDSFDSGDSHDLNGEGKANHSNQKNHKKSQLRQLRFKDENGKVYPKWEEKRLGEVLEIGSGRDYKHLSEGDIPVYGTGGLMTMVNEYLYDGETVCIGRKGTIDKPMYYKGKIWTVDTLFYTHKFKGAIPKFIYFLFQQVNWKLYNEASGVPSLSKTTIEKLKFEFPAVEEQQKIASYLSAIDTKIESVANQIAQTQTFKKGLLQQMFV